MNPVDSFIGLVLGWFIGSPTEPGAVERTEARARALMVFLGIGFAIPVFTTIIGFLVSRFDGIGWLSFWVFLAGILLLMLLVFLGLPRVGVLTFGFTLVAAGILFLVEPVDAARYIMYLGLLFGIPVLLVTGAGTTAVVDILAAWYSEQVRKEALAGLTKWYLGLLVWFVVIEFLFIKLGVYANTEVVIGGLIFGAALVAACLAWDRGVGFGQGLIVFLLTAGLVWTVAVSVPSGTWIYWTGRDIRSMLLFDSARIVEQRRIDGVRVSTERKVRQILNNELMEIRNSVGEAKNLNDVRNIQERLRKLEKELGR